MAVPAHGSPDVLFLSQVPFRREPQAFPARGVALGMRIQVPRMVVMLFCCHPREYFALLKNSAIGLIASGI